jgi:hypothetical protein
VRCDGAKDASATGRLLVLQDLGRPLPTGSPQVNRVTADGRKYRIAYQTEIPDVRFELRKWGALHLARGDKEEAFIPKPPATSYTIPGKNRITVPIANGRFMAEMPAPDRVLVVRFEHAQRGIHYYLRRRPW